MPRFRPRISILNALLLTTIVAMAIVIVQLWREVGPLRTEVRQLRNQTGKLSILDPTKTHAIEVATLDDLTLDMARVGAARSEYLRSFQLGKCAERGLSAACPIDFAP